MPLTSLHCALALTATLLTTCAGPDVHADGPGAAAVTRAIAHATPLDWTLGEWVGTRRDADDASVHPIRVRVTPILGGAGQLREMWVEHDGGVYCGMSIQLRESETGQWTRYYANDARGSLVTLRAIGEPDGAVHVWRSGPNRSGRWSENRSEPRRTTPGFPRSPGRRTVG